MEQFSDINEETKVRAMKAYLKQRQRVYDYKKKHPEKNREFAKKYYKLKKERSLEESRSNPSVLEQFNSRVENV
jgi:hypothetical protein